jgi:hypothetical protein
MTSGTKKPNNMIVIVKAHSNTRATNEGHLLEDFDFGLVEPLIERSKLEVAEDCGCAASWSSLSLRARRGVDSEDREDC